MTGRTVQPLVRRIICLSLALLFIWAAYAKLVLPAAGPTMYVQWLSRYPALRYLLPGAEVGLGLWLLAGFWPRFSALTATVVVSAFTGLVIAELMKDHPVPCGCMGAVAAAYEPSAIRAGLLLDLTRNVFIGIACWYSYAVSRKQPVPKAVSTAAEATLSERKW